MHRDSDDEPESTTGAQPALLEYAGPRPRRRGRTLALLVTIWEWGPWAPRPSWPTGLLLLLCCAAAWWLSYHPQAWRLVRTHNIWRSGPNASFNDWMLHVPAADAVLAVDENRQLRLWRPWTDETLLSIGPRTGDIEHLAASGDGSRLITQTTRGESFLWDGRTGQRLAKLAGGTDSYLGNESGGLTAAALSPDGSRLFMLDGQATLMIWDLTGPNGRLIASQPTSGNRSLVRPRLSYSPDGRHVLLLDGARMWIGNAETLRPTLEGPIGWTDPTPTAFVDGGKRLVAVQTSASSADLEVREHDVETGALLRSWRVGGRPDGRVAVTPDGRWICAGVTFYLAGWIDRAAGPDAKVRPGLPDALRGEVQFFPDGKRLLATRAFPFYAAVVDVTTGRHVANLRAPATRVATSWHTAAWKTIISADARFIAAVDATAGQAHVFEHVGVESRWGVVASPRLWLLAALVAALVASLTRDAIDTRRRWGDAGRAGLGTRTGAIQHQESQTASSAPLAHAQEDPLDAVARGSRFRRVRTVATFTLILTGGVALVSPFVWASLEMWDAYTWWYNDGWLIWFYVAHLFAGLGLLMRSRAWEVFTRLLLGAGVLFALMFIMSSDEFARSSDRIFDRIWVIRPTWVATASGAWALLSATLLAALALSRPRAGQHGVERAMP
ncbi:MAG TPA: WD40 repeat domain-containing protein [Tepidisphaeraceae bacterium]|nr:WD40 repeat domain-containing protein [Tepidisphaeraceae bacterium]